MLTNLALSYGYTFYNRNNTIRSFTTQEEQEQLHDVVKSILKIGKKNIIKPTTLTSDVIDFSIGFTRLYSGANFGSFRRLFKRSRKYDFFTHKFKVVSPELFGAVLTRLNRAMKCTCNNTNRPIQTDSYEHDDHYQSSYLLHSSWKFSIVNCIPPPAA